jgi:hypothetical protein
MQEPLVSAAVMQRTFCCPFISGEKRLLLKEFLGNGPLVLRFNGSIHSGFLAARDNTYWSPNINKEISL